MLDISLFSFVFVPHATYIVIAQTLLLDEGVVTKIWFNFAWWHQVITMLNYYP